MPEPRRVAIMLELDLLYKRHAGVFVGTQRYAQEHGWKSLTDEYVAETLAAEPEKPAPYDGVIARATRKLARRAARRNVPVVNVWFSSPAWRTLPGVFSDFAAAGRLRAEHLLARGFRRFAALTNENDRGQQIELRAFLRKLAEADCPCVTAKVAQSYASSLKQWRTTERAIAAWMKDWQLPMGVYVGSELGGPDGGADLLATAAGGCPRTWPSSPAATRRRFASTCTRRSPAWRWATSESATKRRGCWTG